MRARTLRLANLPDVIIEGYFLKSMTPNVEVRGLRLLCLPIKFIDHIKLTK